MAEIEVRRAEEQDQDGVWPLVQRFGASYRPVRASFLAAFSAVLAEADMRGVIQSGGAERRMARIARDGGGRYDGWRVSLTAGEEERIHHR